MDNEKGPHYFNSTDLRGQILNTYEITAKAQNLKVLEFFHENPHAQVTSEDINRLLMPDAPETSPRRALSWLYRRGHVEKVGTVEGKYGRPITLWRKRTTP